MTEQEQQALSERNIALQEVVKAVKACDGKRAIEECRQAIEWQAVIEEESEKNRTSKSTSNTHKYRCKSFRGNIQANSRKAGGSMKAILVSIQPKWVEKIISGEKTIEVRKTAPKEVPFKVYMYETKFINHCKDCKFYSFEDVCFGRMKDICRYGEKARITSKSARCWQDKYAGGKVIGEFICDKVDTILCASTDHRYFSKCGTCLTEEEIRNYCNGNDIYGLHITALKIYDKPRELGEFLSLPKRCRAGCTEIDAMWMCPNCKMLSINRPITRPPQSWMYVEEVTE